MPNMSMESYKAETMSGRRGTSWAKDKETIITTYKDIGRSVMN